MPRRRIRRRLVLALLAVAAVPLASVGLYANHSNTEALRELALSATRDRVTLKARKVEELLAEIRGDVVFLSRSPVLLDLLEESGSQVARRGDLGRQFLSFTGTKPIYASLSYVDAAGEDVVSARHDGLRSWLVPESQLGTHIPMALAPGQVSVRALQRQEGGAPEPVVRYTASVLDRQDRRRGAIVADVFTRRVVDSVREGDGQAWLLDASGQAISPAGGSPPVPVGTLDDLWRRLNGGESTVIEAVDGATISWTPVRVADAVDGDPARAWLLAEWALEGEAFARLRRFRVVFAGLVLLVSGAAVGLSLVLARRIAGPLDTLADGARRLAGGDLAHRLDVRTGDELEQLAGEFNHMGADLEDSYRQLAAREADKAQRLEEVSRQLLESERLAAVGQLAAGVAHEINNPVGVMSMYVQQLQEGEGLSEAQRDKLRIVERHADRLGRITRGLLDFARAREFRHGRFEAALPVRRALEALAPTLQKAGVQASLQVEGAGVVEGDDEQMQQVVENLLLNAVHAAPGGQVEIDVSAADSQVTICVSDDGSGIAEEHLDRLFEPFFTTKEVGQGTGLGLAICYGIVKAHNGSMTAAPRDGGGSTFTVHLPVAGMVEA